MVKYEYLLLKKGCESNIIYDKKVFLKSEIARKDFEKKEIDNVRWFVKSEKEPIFVKFANEVICMILPIYLRNN